MNLLPSSTYRPIWVILAIHSDLGRWRVFEEQQARLAPKYAPILACRRSASRAMQVDRIGLGRDQLIIFSNSPHSTNSFVNISSTGVVSVIIPNSSIRPWVSSKVATVYSPGLVQ